MSDPAKSIIGIVALLVGVPVGILWLRDRVNNIRETGSGLMKRSLEFWDALAPHHWMIENSYLDLSVVRQLLDRIQPPVLVVGAGQGLIVAGLQKEGFHCDGVELSSEMIRHARLRRGLALVQADARAMPFEKGAYKTIIYATGVVDFMSDEAEIRAVMNEGRRIADHAGMILVAFGRISASTEKLLVRLGLLNNNVLHHRESLEIYRLNPAQAVAWVARRAKVGYAQAALLALGARMGILHVAGKEKRIPPAENIRQPE